MNTNLEGYMVITPSGRIGLAGRLNILTGLYEVQFGASGPFHEYLAITLRKALKSEVEAQDLVGIGALPAPKSFCSRGRPRKLKQAIAT